MKNKKKKYLPPKNNTALTYVKWFIVGGFLLTFIVLAIFDSLYNEPKPITDGELNNITNLSLCEKYAQLRGVSVAYPSQVIIIDGEEYVYDEIKNDCRNNPATT